MAGFGVQPFGTTGFGTSDSGGPGTYPLMATPQPTAIPPRIRLDVTTTHTSVTIYRVSADGTRSPVRTYDGAPLPVSAGSAFIFDPEAPYGQPVSYVTDYGVSTPPVILDVSDVWLVDPTVPSRSMIVDVISVSDRSAAANQSVRYPLGRKYPIVVTDGVRKAGSFTLTLHTPDSATLAGLDQILAGLNPLLLNVPPSLGWIDPATEYVSVGDLTRSNPAGGSLPSRFWSLPCSVVARPAGGSQSFNTYGISHSLYPTYAARRAAHATYGQAFDPS